jgi:hypothetical protein
MSEKNELKDKLEGAATEVKEKAGEAVEKLKESNLGKSVLGEDGKFDKEDVERLAEGAKEAVKGAVDKVKDLFNK